MTSVDADVDYLVYAAFTSAMDRGMQASNGAYKWGGPEDPGEGDLFIEAPDGTVYSVEVSAMLTRVCQECYAFAGFNFHYSTCSSYRKPLPKSGSLGDGVDVGVGTSAAEGVAPVGERAAGEEGATGL